MSAEQIKQQLGIVNTLKFMAIQVQRIQASATIVGDGTQALELDTLQAQIDKLGIIADETLINLRNLLDTQEMAAIVIYDADGKAIAS